MGTMSATPEGNNMTLSLRIYASFILYVVDLTHCLYLLFSEPHREEVETIAPTINVGCDTVSIVKAKFIGLRTPIDPTRNIVAVPS